MALETNLNVTPYYDDFDEAKNYYKILFKPGVAVQARELNQLQTILQDQIEQFGDNIFKRGTIIDGCNFSFYPSYQYVKIVDTQKDGLTAVPANYVGFYARSVNTDIGVTAFVKNYVDGFESTDPNLKTLYLDYTNSGTDANTQTFSPGEVITIYDPAYTIHGVTINNGGVNFSNSDSVIFTSAVVVNVSSGSFTNGEYIQQPDTGANVQIIGIDVDTLRTENQVILKIRPTTADLIAAAANTAKWSIANSFSIKNTSNTAQGVIEDVIGSGASATIVTDSLGKIQDVTMLTRGTDYYVLPHVSVYSANNSTGVGLLNFEAKNYIANVQVAQVSNAVGAGYAFGVSEGVIFQKGYFERVEPQIVIVDNYSMTPNAIAVGFDTAEEIIDSNIDPELLDNATGTSNENAPGADRMKLTPELVVLSSEEAAANDNFFVLAEWSEGRPYKQNQKTAYNKLNDELALRTYEESGDYVINRFEVTTKSTANTDDTANNFTVVVDPGLAYISGHRVETRANYTFDVKTGHDVKVVNNQSISLDYGNYVRIKEVGGIFQFNTGDQVQLYSAPKGFLSNTSLVTTGNLVPQGTQIGTAYMRSLMHFDGQPGTNTAVYKLYLFDIEMNKGKNFRDVRSVYYVNGTKKGIADINLTLDPSLGQSVAKLESTNNSKLLFPAGVYSMKNSSNSTYTYRTIDQSLTVSNSGVIEKSLASIANEYYTFVGDMASSQRNNFYVVPTGGNLIANNALAGNGTTSTTSANVDGTDTTFLAELQVGDYIHLANNSTTAKRRVVSVINNTRIIVDSNLSFTSTETKIYRYFPQHVPVDFSIRTGSQNNHVINVDTTAKLLSVQFKYSNGTNMEFQGTTATDVAVAVNIERRNVNAISKSATRNVFVKLRLANNVAKAAGPWCLGVPDAFRLRSVYVGNSSVNSSAFPDAIDDFYIDHNQTENSYDLSYLYKKPTSGIDLTTDDYLLVEFDYGVSTAAGYLDTSSYLGTSNVAEVLAIDSLPLANLTVNYNTLEIPELNTKRGNYYDLTNTFDFRPRVANTVALTSGNEATAPVNPAYVKSYGDVASTANEKKFPLPESVFKTNISHYLGRIDSVFVDSSGDIFTLSGVPVDNMSRAIPPENVQYAMRLNDIIIKPYPNIPHQAGSKLSRIIDRNIANEGYTKRRFTDRRLQTTLTPSEIERNQPISYSMADIGNLDRRISDLEYYVSLSLLENAVKDKVIPSSIDPTIPRFKYGFFVDDFSTTDFSDLDSKSYTATVEQDDLVPETNYIGVTNHRLDIHPSYIDHPIVKQMNATGAITTDPVVTIANNIIVSKEPAYYEGEIRNVKMADKSGPVTLYGHFYSGKDSIFIYQGDTLIKSSADAEVLLTSDKTFMKSNAIPDKWFSGINFKNFTYDSGNDAIVNSFKITWTHNPANGTEYTIKVVNKSVIWRYALQYPINNNVTDAASTTSATVLPPVSYTGIMTVTPKF